jgi:hypothetical protein
VIPPGPNLAIDFYDPLHGFAVWVKCPNNITKPDVVCSRYLSSTQDGKTWTDMPVPPAMPGYHAHVQALGQQAALVEVSGDSASRLFTGDAGKTWTDVSRLPTGGKLELIPDGAILEIKCSGFTASPNTDCVHDPVNVVVPQTGEVFTLANQPPFQATQSQLIPDRTGTWWIAGLEYASGNPLIAKSTDRGRSWQVSLLPEIVLDEKTHLTVYAANEQTRYVMVTKGLELEAILRSADGGKTWEQTWRAFSSLQPTGSMGPMDVRPDGTLIVRSGARFYVSRDGGHTFQPGDKAPQTLPSSLTRAGVVTVRPDADTGAFHFEIADGVTTVTGEVPRP